MNHNFPSSSGPPNFDRMSDNEKLVFAYIAAEYPLHCRRTLEAATNSLGRNDDQVVYRSTRSELRESESKILLLDQLWLIIIEGGEPYYFAS
jgi:hypothetical protein